MRYIANNTFYINAKDAKSQDLYNLGNKPIIAYNDKNNTKNNNYNNDNSITINSRQSLICGMTDSFYDANQKNDNEASVRKEPS